MKNKNQNKMKKEENSFDKTVEMMDGCDAIHLSHYDKKLGIVLGEPYNTKTGMSYALGMISSVEEMLKCKYIKVCDNKDKELNKLLAKQHKKINKNDTQKRKKRI